MRWRLPMVLTLLALSVYASVTSSRLLAQDALPQPIPASQSASALPVIINEILSHTDDPLIDSIELFNRTGQPVDISGWCLSDDAGTPCRSCLPSGLQVPANGFLVLDENLFGFRLDEVGEELLLTQGAPTCTPSGAVHRIRFDASANGVSLGRLVTSNGVESYPQQRARTLGSANAGPILPPRLAIVEVAANPASSDPVYVEILNPGALSVPLFDPVRPANRWRVGGLGTTTLPQSSLAPGASIYLTNVPVSQFRSRYSLPASALVVRYAGTLQAAGERITVESPEPPNIEDGLVPFVVVDEVGAEDTWPWFGAGATRQSLTTFAQEPAAWGSPSITLDGGAAVQGLRLAIVPAGGGRGRIVRWQSAREWRAASYSVTIESLPTGNAPGADLQQTIVLELPASGSRHTSAGYAAAHQQAIPGGSYRYTLRVRWWDGSEQLLASVDAGPETQVLVPIVRIGRP